MHIEVATRTGKHSAAILWTFQKLFDNVRVNCVIGGALALGFPLVDLVLGLHMHLASRRLRHFGCVYFDDVLFHSIIVGCALAIYFTKALLKPHIV